MKTLSWLGATIAACITLTAGAFTIFFTKAEAEQMKMDIVSRLDRIEAKLDQLVFRKN